MRALEFRGFQTGENGVPYEARLENGVAEVETPPAPRQRSNDACGDALARVYGGQDFEEGVDAFWRSGRRSRPVSRAAL
jgi:hypothetical protein